MANAGSSGPVGRAAYDEAFPRVSDALTLYLWRRPALLLTGWAVKARVPTLALTLFEALLALLVFALFWRGHYWPGLLLALAVMVASVAGLVLARLTHAPQRANRSRIALEIVHPILWWWGWEHGLGDYGRAFEPVYATMVLWVVVGGTVAMRVIEGLALHRFNGMQIHAWRPVDTRFRLVSASRNTNLVLLAGGLSFDRPDSGLVLVAWWTLISLIIHAVRFAQLTELQARRQKIASWLDR